MPAAVTGKDMPMLKVADADTTSRHLDYGRLIEALDRGFAQGCIVPMRHHHTIEKDG